jgi:hypothetical protein
MAVLSEIGLLDLNGRTASIFCFVILHDSLSFILVKNKIDAG